MDRNSARAREAELGRLRARVAELERLAAARGPLGPGPDAPYRLLFDANRLLSQVSDAIIAVDTERRVTYWNDGAVRLYGFAPAEALGHRIEDVTRYRWIDPDDERAAWEALAVTGAWRGENLHLTKTGEERYVESSVSVIRDEAGQPAGLLAVIRDVTERKRAEAALRDSEARKTAILESALDCIVTIDSEGQIIEFNPAAEKTFGYTRADAIGRPLAELIVPPSLRDRHRQAMARYLATGQGGILGKRIELTAMRADGSEFPVELTITRVDLPGPPVFTGYVRDIIEPRRAQGELEHRRRENEELAGLARTLTETRDIAAVGERMVESVVSLYGLHAAVVRLREPDGSLVDVAWGGAGRDLFPPGHVVQPGTGVSGRAVIEGRPVWSRDILDDPAINLTEDMRARIALMGVHAVLAVPLRVAQKVIGVLSVAHQVARAFTPAEAAVLQAFADEAALALQSARLYEETVRRRREAEVIAEVAATINASLDLDTVLQRVTDVACELCHSDLAEIAVSDSTTGAMRFRYWAGVRSARYRQAVVERGRGAGGRVLLTGRPLRTADYLEDPGITQEYATEVREEGVVALMVTPIVIEGAAEGLVYVGNRAPRPFTDEDEAVLTRLAEHAAIAIRNARLFDSQVRLARETERQHQEALALELVARQITASLEREEVLQRIVDRARALCGCDLTLLAVCVEGAEVADIVASSGARSDTLLSMTIARGRGVGGRVLETGEPFTTSDYVRDPRVSKDYVDAAIQEGTVAQAAVPIRLRGAITGVLSAVNRSARDFSDRDLAILSKLADQAAIALENSRLYAERVQAEVEVRGRARQQAAIAELGQRALMGTAPGALMDEAVAVVVQTLDVEYGAVFERLLDRAALVLRTGRGWTEGAVGRATLTGDPGGLDAPLLREHGVAGSLSVPVAAGESPFGVLAAYTTRARAFTDDDARFLQSIAHVLATAIERCRAEERLSESERRLREAQQVGQIGSWEWDIAADIVTWSDQLYRIYGLEPQQFHATYHGFLERVHPEDRAFVRSVVEGSLASQEPFTCECRIVRPDGAVRTLYSRGQVVTDARGRPVRMVGIGQDVTERKRADDALRQRAERLHIQHEIDQAIAAARSPEAIAQAVLRRIRALVPCRRASVMLFDFDAQEAVAIAVEADGVSRLPAGIRLPLEAIGDIADLRAGKVRMVEDVDAIADPPPLTRAARSEGIRAYLAIPLLSQQTLIGSLGLSADAPGAFPPEHVEIAAEVAASLAVAIQDARLFAQVLAGRERLQALSRRLVEVQEEERRHIARELHDEIGQVLTGLKLSLETGTRGVGTPARLEEARGLVNDLIARVRELSLDLRPAVLDDFGLLPALFWHFERYTSQTGIRVAFEHAEVNGRFRPEVETAAYRIVQEALTNVARHAGVGEVIVRAWTDGEALSVQVEDRGRGFEPAVARLSGGLGGMRERATLLGGQLTVESEPGAGTRITLELPLGAPMDRRQSTR